MLSGEAGLSYDVTYHARIQSKTSNGWELLFALSKLMMRLTELNGVSAC
jgi:hypothetical protein